MSKQYVAQSILDDWQVSPRESDWANYDEPHVEYREHVKNFLRGIPTKTLRKKAFFTISTNVLCADQDSSDDTLPPAVRDIYLPLEISLTKWSLSLGKIPIEDREILSKTWMINPGKPTRGSICISMDHAKLTHKIDIKPDDTDNPYVSYDLNKVVSEINQILTSERIVFSSTVRHIRQDLGCLKWLNIQTGSKTKPIRVYGIEDLFVCLIHRLKADCPYYIGRGLAMHKLTTSLNVYDPELMCDYHRVLAETDEGQCSCCASCLSISHSHVVIDNVCNFTGLWKELDGSPNGDASLPKSDSSSQVNTNKSKQSEVGQSVQDPLSSQFDKLNISQDTK